MLTQAGLLTLTSAVLFALGLPNELFPLGSPFVGLIALVPFYLTLSMVESARVAARLGALFGAVSTFIANYWLMFFRDYSVWTIGGTTLGYAGYNFVLAGFLWIVTRSPRAYRPILFALVWTGYEYLKSIGFLAYPWGLAAYPLNSFIVLSQLAAVTGVWGISFLVVYANTSFAELLSWRPGMSRAETWITIRHLGFAALLFAVAIGYGIVHLRTQIPTHDAVDMVLVQQNADAWSTSNISRPLLTSQAETEAALREAAAADPPLRPELIVWSETSLRYLYVEGHDWYTRNPREKPFTDFLRELPAPLLTGAPFIDPDDESEVYNAVLMIEPDGTVAQWYGKQHLVPFAEAIPFWSYAAVRSFFESVVGLGGVWTPGPGSRMFTITGDSGSTVTVATPICFEDGFAYLNRRFVRAGADLIVNLTNNSWSRTNSAQLQHFVAARYRAIETQRGLVRSTNSGFTCLVDPWGRVVASIPMFTTDHLNVTVPVYTPASESLYMAWGDYLPVCILIGLAALLVVWAVRTRAGTKEGAFRRPL